MENKEFNLEEKSFGAESSEVLDTVNEVVLDENIDSLSGEQLVEHAIDFAIEHDGELSDEESTSEEVLNDSTDEQEEVEPDEDFSEVDGELNREQLGELSGEDEDMPVISETLLEIKEKQLRLKEEMRTKATPNLDYAMESGFLDEEGNMIESRQQGTLELVVLPIDPNLIKSPKRIRTDSADVADLQNQIKMFGQLTPIHVVPFGRYYLLLDGERRMQALSNLGENEVLAYIDETIPAKLVKYYEAVINGKKAYKFSEMVYYARLMLSSQGESFEVNTIDGILGLRPGEVLKALYIDNLKAEFPDIYNQVEKGKMSIEQAQKKIDKEIEKAEKEQSAGIDALNDGSLDDELRNTNELMGINVDAQQQELGNRKLLDPVTRRFVENRDNGYCQCCEFGKGEPDFMGVFQVHHIIPVQYGGSDAKTNLILLCNNCHTLVHDYEKGRFIPEQDTYDKFISVKKIVVLGNMLLTMRKKGLQELRRSYVEIGRQVDAGKVTIGQGLVKAGLDLKGEQYFDGSPYDTFKSKTEDLEYGGIIEGELGVLSYSDEEEQASETVQEETVTETLVDKMAKLAESVEDAVEDVQEVISNSEDIEETLPSDINDDVDDDDFTMALEDKLSVTDSEEEEEEEEDFGEDDATEDFLSKISQEPTFEDDDDFFKNNDFDSGNLLDSDEGDKD